MKIVIVSDIHANLAALEALPERNFDQLWCIGDLVDYGPRPHEVAHWVTRHAAIAVRGNHDHAAGFAVDPQCSEPYKRLASETLAYTLKTCTKGDLKFLRELPLYRTWLARQPLSAEATSLCTRFCSAGQIEARPTCRLRGRTGIP